MEALYIIAALAGIWGAFLKTLEHFNLTLPGFAKLLSRQHWGKIFRRVYIGVAAVISLMLFSLIGYFIYLSHFTNRLSIIIFVDMALLGTWGIWMPAFTNVQNKRLTNVMSIIGAPLLALLFAGYWIYQWPEWHTPALLTSLFLFMLVLLLVYSLIEKRKNKAKLQSVNAPK